MEEFIMKAKKILAVLLVAIMLLVPFSSVAGAANRWLVSGPIITAYKDTEYFNPQGIVISVDGVEVTYTPDNENFKFVPALDELLSTTDMIMKDEYNPELDENGYKQYTTDVAIYYNEQLVDTITVSVKHDWGETTYFDDTHHGNNCKGCGIVDEVTFGPHNVKQYIPNDDGGLFIEQSETGTCEDCHAEVTRKIPGTHKFESIFTGDYTETESTILTYVTTILVTLIQFLTGIR
jgi:hypothetical protein